MAVHEVKTRRSHHQECLGLRQDTLGVHIGHYGHVAAAGEHALRGERLGGGGGGRAGREHRP